TCTPLWVSDLAEWGAGPAVTEALSADGTGAMACLPLAVSGETIGGLRIMFQSKRRFSADDRAFMQVLAQECALSLERVRLSETERIAAERSTLLAEIGAKLASSLDWGTIVQNIARLPVPSFAAACVVYLAKDGFLLPQAASCAPADMDALWESALSGPPLSEDAPTDEHLSRVSSLGMTSVIVSQLRSRGASIGAISFTRKSLSPFVEDDIRFAEVIARRAELALENARLYQTAQSAIHERDRFLAMASHELKTPLNPLQIQLELLLRSFKTGTPPRAEERLTVAVGQVRRLNRLIEDLLNVSRMDAGKLLVEIEEVELRALVRDVAARFEAEIGQAGCTLTVSGPQVCGSWDRLRIDQVITNLLSNALKYGRGKPIDVSIAGDGERAYLLVKDQGIGISILDQRRLFGRFERAVAERHYSGFGLGLWIVRQIVEAHGGTVNVESNVGEGSVFRVELPRVMS
ncbi:MAG: ATP-binding protein, partial [Polyangiaceae bacterium]